MLKLQRATEEGITQLLRLKRGIEEFREEYKKGKLTPIEGLLSKANKQLLRRGKVKQQIGEATNLIPQPHEKQECRCKWYSQDKDSTR